MKRSGVAALLKGRKRTFRSGEIRPRVTMRELHSKCGAKLNAFHSPLFENTLPFLRQGLTLQSKLEPSNVAQAG